MGGARITDEQHSQIIERSRSGESITEIARSMGISPYAVRCHSQGVRKQSQKGIAPSEPGEEWVDIEGYDGRYMVSSFGRVFASGVSGGPCKILKIYGTKNGYDHVLLSDGTQHKHFVHRLVAEHFCEGRDDENNEVRHVDGNLKNNRSDNLEWCDYGDVSMYVKGRHDKTSSTVSERQIGVARAMYHFGASVADIARNINVRYDVARNITDGSERFDSVDLLAMPGEEWKAVDGFGGKYYVSSFGRVFSTGGKTRKGGLLHIITAKNGYQSVALSGNGQRGSTPLHRLVALHFCEGHDETNNVVNHIDGNPSNNHADNLEWCTQSYNIRHAIDVLGRNIGVGHPCSEETKKAISAAKRGKPGHSRKFSDDEIRAIRSDPRSSTQLAKAMGVNKSTIQNIRNRVTYSYVE